MALPQPPGMMRGMTLAPPDHDAVAVEALEAMDGARQIAPFSARYPGLTLEDAYRILACLCKLINHKLAKNHLDSDARIANRTDDQWRCRGLPI